MLAGVDFQLAVHLLTELRLRKHARNGELNHARRARFPHAARSGFNQAARIPGVAAIKLLTFFRPGQPNLRGVDDDHMIARVNRRRIDRFVLAHQEHSGATRHPAKDGVIRVNHMPGANNFVSGRKLGARRQTSSLRSKSRTIQSSGLGAGLSKSGYPVNAKWKVPKRENLMSKAVDNLMKAMERAAAIRPKVGGFPYLAESLRRAGVTRNLWSLPACQSLFLTDEGPVVVQGVPLVSGAVDVPVFDRDALIAALRTDQAGESTFPEFLEASWRAGVVRYDVDFFARTVAYFGCNGEEYIEAYPAVKID